MFIQILLKMEVSREILITYDHDDRKQYLEMIDRLTVPKKVGFRQYIELTQHDRILLERMRKALTVFDDPKNNTP